jgi:hypothetical protein
VGQVAGGRQWAAGDCVSNVFRDRKTWARGCNAPEPIILVAAAIAAATGPIAAMGGGHGPQATAWLAWWWVVL